MENISLDEFNTTLTKINKEYLSQMPTWLKIAITVGITIFIIGIIVGCYVCRVRGVRLEWCLLKQNQYDANNQNNSFKNSSRNTPSISNLQSVHIEHPHLEEMKPLKETRHNSKMTKMKITRATPDSVAEALSELLELDFTKFYKKKSDRAHRSQTTFDL